jgi:hypothetical protein
MHNWQSRVATVYRRQLPSKVKSASSSPSLGRNSVGPEPRDKIYDSSRQTTIFYAYLIGYRNPKTLSYGRYLIWHRTDSLVDLIHGDFIPFLLDTAP